VKRFFRRRATLLLGDAIGIAGLAPPLLTLARAREYSGLSGISAYETEMAG